MRMLALAALFLIASSSGYAADNLIAEQPNSLLLSLQQGPTRPVFGGRTGLPDGSALLITVERVTGLSIVDRSPYMGQSRATVTAGYFKTEAFRDSGGELNGGSYLVEIDGLMPEDVSTLPPVGNPTEALLHNTERAVLTGHIVPGITGRHIHWRVPLYLSSPGPRREIWFGTPD
jgi:hypothetical protein